MARRYRERRVFWGAQWARPLESLESLSAKLNWINTSSPERRQLFERKIVSSDSELLQLLGLREADYELIPAQLFFHKEPMAVCLKCLEAGFHSRVPQLVGLKHCPIHSSPLRFSCATCERPYVEFANSSFKADSVYICGGCGSPLVADGYRVVNKWNMLSDAKILASFSPYLRGLQNAANALRGNWYLHPVDRRHIFYYQTGYCLARAPEVERHQDSLYESFGKRSSITYSLPMDEEKLSVQVKQVMAYDLVLMQQAAGVHHARQDERAQLPSLHVYGDCLTYWLGANRLAAAESLREQLLADAGRMASQSPSPYILAKPIPDHNKVFRQLRVLLAAHSLGQIVRQLSWLELFCAWHLKGKASNIDCREHFRHLNNYYAGLLEFKFKKDDYYDFNTSIERWWPNYQLLQVDASLVVKIFRHAPQAREQERPGAAEANDSTNLVFEF